MSRSRPKEVKLKSPSERLRGTFYKIFEQDSEGFEEFDEYYASKMEKLITHYKKLIK
jgi:uncharacterized protein YeaO (DUF488 family)